MDSATHDAARYIFDQAHYALTNEDQWSPAQPPPLPKHYPADPSSSPTTTTRLTRNKSKRAQQQESSEQQQQQAFENYSPSRYINDEPQIPLDGDQSGPYANPASMPTNVYSYPSSFPVGESPSPPGGAPSHPPPPHQVGAGVPIHPASLTNVYPYPPGMMIPGRPEGFAAEDMPAPTMYGPSSSLGGEIMRVPSASPSVASGSPPPEDYPPPLDYQLPSSRGSSRPKSLENYEYPGSGPISPLSSSYAPQALPSTFSAATGGYLHGPPASQNPQPSSNSFQDSESDLALATPMDPTTPGGRGRPGQKTKTKLTDMDRKFICVFAQNHPKARQEDIATKFAVERSTVSKILKCKEKWMKVDFFSSEARVVKHRPSKFPELEASLIHQIRMRIATREPVNDSFIKKMALELAQARGIGKDKFKASSGWVENFKHRHDLRKGGLWDKGGSMSWAAAAAAAKYSQGSNGDANGHGLGSIGSGDDPNGSLDADEEYHDDAPYGVIGQVGDPYHEGVESNPLDEANKTGDGERPPVPSLSFHPDGGQDMSHHHHPHYPGVHPSVGQYTAELQGPPGGFGMYPGQPSIAGVDSSPPGNGSPSIKQGPNPDFFPGDPTSIGNATYHFYPQMHLTTPRSTSVTSRSTSSASGPSIGGSPASVQSAILPGGRHGSPSSVSPPSSGSRRYSGLPPGSVAALRGHAHRRSMSGSGSYTSSPLAVEVGDVPPSPAGSSLALHGVPHPYASSRPNRRSVTFSSFSAMMAAGLNLDSSNDGGRVPTRKGSLDERNATAARYGHSRSISHGSAGSSSSYNQGVAPSSLTSGSPQQQTSPNLG